MVVMNLRQKVTPMTCLVFLLWTFLRIAVLVLGVVIGNLTHQIWVTAVIAVLGFIAVQFLIRRMDTWQLQNRK
jgi:primosomal replication protein N